MLDPTDPEAYTIGWICALPTESIAAQLVLDEEFEAVNITDSRDTNSYQYGRIKDHYVVIAILPSGYGKVNAATVGTNLLRSFPNVRIGLTVGIGGGAPSPKDIRLGDVVVGTPQGKHTGILQHDFGKSIQGVGFQRMGRLNSPPQALLTAVSNLQTNHARQGNGLKKAVGHLLKKNTHMKESFARPDSDTDILFEAEFIHQGKACDSCDSCLRVAGKVKKRTQRADKELKVHYGTIASGDELLRDANRRDRLASDEGVLCFEMETAGLMNSFPCLVIRGICDYSDSHKNKIWQGFAAMAAAAYAKQLLCVLRPRTVRSVDPLKWQLSECKTPIYPLKVIATEQYFLVSSQVSRTQRSIQAIHDGKSDADILEWLSDINSGAHHDDVFSLRAPHTGHWLLESPTYQEWIQGNGRVLFCPGIPGAGKTILTSIVINDLTERFRDTTKTSIAYIYCRFKRSDMQQVSRLLASLLKQFCYYLPSVPDIVRELFETHFKKQTRPQLSQTREILEKVACSFSRSFIVVDGLDEWSEQENDQWDLTDELLRLHERTGIDLFATSRCIPHILDKFSRYPSLHISCHEDDVRLYVEQNLWRISKHLDICESLEDQIKAGICKTCHGM
jgi:nucleoside phosphorylase